MAIVKSEFNVLKENGENDVYYFKTLSELVMFSDNKSLEEKINLKEKLWEGSNYMTENDIVRLKKPLDQCLNGIILWWSDYNPGGPNDIHKVGNNYNWVPTFIPKYGPAVNSGNFYCAVPNIDNHYQNNNIVVKTIYIKNDRIEGSGNDDNTAHDGKDVVLREVWEV